MVPSFTQQTSMSSLTKVSEAVDRAMGGAINKVQEEMYSKVKGVRADIIEDLEKKIDNIRLDLEEKQKRISNLFLYDMEESYDIDLKAQQIEDCKKVSDYIKKLGLYTKVDCHESPDKSIRLGTPQIYIKSHDRIGAKKEGVSNKRPIKLVLGSNYEREMVLTREAKAVREGKLVKRRMTNDYTKKEREEHKKLQEELKVRREQGEKDLYIRGNSIIQRKQPFRGTPRNNEAGTK